MNFFFTGSKPCIFHLPSGFFNREVSACLPGGSATYFELADSVCNNPGKNILILHYRGWLINHDSQYIQANGNVETVYATLYKEQPLRITQQT